MAAFKIPKQLILDIIALIIQFMISGMSEKEAVNKAAKIKGVSPNAAMNMWKNHNK